MVRRDIEYEVQPRTAHKVSITVTSPEISKNVADLFQKLTDEARNLQINLQKGNDAINLWLDDAFEEGLEQAVESVEEWYKVKQFFDNLKEPEVKQGEEPEIKRQKSGQSHLHYPTLLRCPCQMTTKRGDLEEALPISWPVELPLPVAPRSLIRQSGGDREWEGIDRGPAQRKFAEEIRRNREKNIPPPHPCFSNDAEPNAPYDAHHAHPLYIGGEDSEFNLCALRADLHQKGHPRLDNQTEHLFEYQKCRHT